MKLKTRKEMDAAYQWDLSPIFPDQAAWEKAYAAAAQAVDAVGALAGTLGASSAQMKAGLDTIYETLQAVERVYLYASLLKNSDNGDAEYQRMEGMAMNLYAVSYTHLRPQIEPPFLSFHAWKVKGHIRSWLGERRVRIPIMSHSFSVLPARLARSLFDMPMQKQPAYTIFYSMPK